MRRIDKQTSRERALASVDSCLYVSVATINPDGTPYCFPISVARERNVIYFHCAREGKKLDNIRANPSVCVSCVAYANDMEDSFSVSYESAIASGKAYIVTDEDEKARALRMLCEHHTPKAMGGFDEEMKKNAHRCEVVRVEVDEITGKRG